MKRLLASFLIGGLLSINIGDAMGQAIRQTTPVASESLEQRDTRMKWWREAHFGMLITWGLYSVPAGIHNGQTTDMPGEWIMYELRIPVAEYAKYARRFNPTKFDARKWVLLAKQAGMKYIIITSKHCEGFAMFPSKASRFNIFHATPFWRDPLKELADACHRLGIKLGFYYSQDQDWHHPGGSAWGGHWDTAQDGDLDQYLDEVAIPQVREILSNYGKISVLWWDMPIAMTPERAERFLPLLQLQPNIITNNRLGGGVAGDFETPEQYIPPTGLEGRDWETCMTMNDTWGYKADDQNWKSATTLIRNLIDIASKGGNYLLNVGPSSKGEIPPASIARLQEIGKWMNVNKEAIYGTIATPFAELPFEGRCTRKADRLYFHIFEWPENRQLRLPAVSNIKSAYLLINPTENLPIQLDESGKFVTLPYITPDPHATVLALELDE